MRNANHRIAGTIIMAVCLIAFTSSLFAAQPESNADAGAACCKIEGVVKDLETGNIVKNALITVEGHNKSAMTNSAGKFYLENVPTGSRVMKVTKRGYQTLQSNVDLNGGKKISVKVSLEGEKKAEIRPEAGITVG